MVESTSIVSQCSNPIIVDPKVHRGEETGAFHVLANQQNVYRTQVELIKKWKGGEAFFGRMHPCVEL